MRTGIKMQNSLSRVVRTDFCYDQRIPWFAASRIGEMAPCLHPKHQRISGEPNGASFDVSLSCEHAAGREFSLSISIMK